MTLDSRIQALVGGTPNVPSTLPDTQVTRSQLLSVQQATHNRYERISESFCKSVDVLLRDLTSNHCLPVEYSFKLDLQGGRVLRIKDTSTVVYRHDNHGITVLQQDAWLPRLIETAHKYQICVPFQLKTEEQLAEQGERLFHRGLMVKQIMDGL